MHFDYIIIGAGSAGGMLATRLSEDGRQRVLLLEGGGSHKDFLIDMPAGWGQMIYDPRYSWGHETEPERWAGDRRVALPRGKRLGGSSSINGMVYVRGDRADYDSWAALGAAGWSWQELLPYFVRTESQQRGDGPFAKAWHGRSGPLTAADLRDPHPVSLAMVEAAVQTGLPRCADFNDGHPNGAGLLQVNLKDGRRSSIARNAIEPALARDNLTLRSGALVERIVIEAGRARGVQWRAADGSRHSASAAREVLLCAGALQSPQLLMLSGIGPAEHLRELGIAVHADLPGVGANLQDHAIVPMTWRLNPHAPSLNKAYRMPHLLGALLRYAFTRRGPMAMPAAEFAAWFSSDPALPYRDIQVHGLPVTGDVEGFMRDGKKYSTEPFPGMTLAPYQVRPYSRGSIRLRSREAAEHPAIRMNYLHDERDRRALLHGLRMVRQIASAPALASLVQAETRPGAAVQSDEEWLSWLGPYLGSGHHASCSCRMGAPDDPLAVVSPELKVKGIEALRVIDASVMPHLVSGNTNAAAVVIGDKGADLVLGRAPLAPLEASSDLVRLQGEALAPL
jgi:choline dehydrogenase